MLNLDLEVSGSPEDYLEHLLSVLERRLHRIEHLVTFALNEIIESKATQYTIIELDEYDSEEYTTMFRTVYEYIKSDVRRKFETVNTPTENEDLLSDLDELKRLAADFFLLNVDGDIPTA